MNNKNLEIIGVLGLISSVGASSAILGEEIAKKYGHTFFAGSQNPLLFGLMGAVSLVASLVIFESYRSEKSYKKFMMAYLITPIILSEISLHAANLNLIAARLSLLGTLILIGNGIIGIGLYMVIEP